MKVLFTVNTYFPMKDGVSTVTQYLAEGLAKQGYEVVVFTRLFHNLEKQTTINCVKVERFNINVKHSFYCGDKKVFQDRVIQESNTATALINVCTQCPTTDWCFKMLDRIKCYKILYMHGMYDFSWKKHDLHSLKAIIHKLFNSIRWGIYYRVNKKKFIKYNRITQLHRFDNGFKYFYKKYGIESTIIQNAIDNTFFENSVLEKSPLEEKYILNVSNYCERKNQLLLVDAYFKSDCYYTLVLIGSEENDYSIKLKNRVDILKKSNPQKKVLILSNVDRKMISKYTHHCEFYCMTSKWEAFPISLVEAMACEKAFISTDVGIASFLPGGLISKNSDEIVFWINFLVKNAWISKMLGKIGKRYAIENMRCEDKVLELINIISGDAS